MRDFFKHLTVKKVFSILIGAIFLFLGGIWSTYIHQKITNSSWMLERNFGANTNTFSTQDIEIYSSKLHIHTLGDTTKPSLLIVPGRGSGLYKWRYMLQETDILDHYALIFVDQTDLAIDISNKDIAGVLGSYIKQSGSPVHIIASGGGTYTALHLLDTHQELIEKAVLISGRYNTLIDKSDDAELTYMKYAGWLLSPNFTKAWHERQDIEADINPLLQRLSAKIETPLLLMHGTYNLSLNVSHATYLQEVLRISNSTVLTDTKQLRLKKHSKLLYGSIDGFLE